MYIKTDEIWIRSVDCINVSFSWFGYCIITVSMLPLEQAEWRIHGNFLYDIYFIYICNFLQASNHFKIKSLKNSTYPRNIYILSSTWGDGENKHIYNINTYLYTYTYKNCKVWPTTVIVLFTEFVQLKWRTKLPLFFPPCKFDF